MYTPQAFGNSSEDDDDDDDDEEERDEVYFVKYEHGCQLMAGHTVTIAI